VIRRGFWLVTGAVLGVTGYRKVNKLARALTTGPGAGSRVLRTAALGRHALGALPALAARQHALSARQNALAVRQTRPVAEQAHPSAQRGLAQDNSSGGAAGFVRDVREGMAEYWDLHRRDFDRTPGGQSGRSDSGAN
jgi:hypothetical protein